MDRGAHFFKCDFQVHTPRDIAWTGRKFGVNPDELHTLTPERRNEIDKEREEFAKEYLSKVRQAGLNAIAITDHHDVVFAKILRRVAESENRELIEAERESECITVFPGIELTLANPVSQALLIFDADFNDYHLDSVLHSLGLAPSNEYERATCRTERISQEQINDLSHLHRKLNELQYCREKYIVLPNVTSGGQHSILRNGFQEHYKKMPCAGGYVDKAISNDSGYLNKLNGGDPNYGSKAIGVISTSDNRYEDGRELGKFYTWIKWAEPSAEALRQACLARQSRLSQEEPQLPQIHITKLDVTNSKFLGSFSIEFNRQYNALIGGRGTGKSTVLEYLRWGLCDQTLFSEPDEATEIERRRKALIDKTLFAVQGEVRVTFSVNGINHIVKRNSVTKETLLKIDGGNFEAVKEEDVRQLLPIHAYSQKQLSSVGVRTEELKRFIQQPVASELKNLDYQLEDIIQSIKKSYQALVRKSEIQAEIDQFGLEIRSFDSQAESLRASLSGISPEDHELISKKQKLDNEVNFVSKVEKEWDTISSKISDLENTLLTYPEKFSKEGITLHLELINSIDEARIAQIEALKVRVSQLSKDFGKEGDSQISTQVSKWRNSVENFNESYERAKSKTTSNEQQLSSIAVIEGRLAKLREIVNERHAVLKGFGTPEEDFEQKRAEFFRIHEEKIQLLDQQVQKFTMLSQGVIRADVTRSIDIRKIKLELGKVFSGSRIREERFQAICDVVQAAPIPLECWKLVLEELRSLAEFKIKDDNPNHLPETLKLVESGFSNPVLLKIAEVLTTDNWLNLATLKVEFDPEFTYTTNSEMGDVIPFSEASAGQQATALLTVLLNQPGTPLLIDQPEDDIDNRAIDDIIKNIWNAKKNRQLIFTSHNANLVVNGDAELVVCFDYRDSGQQTRGRIKAEGAIDNGSVKNEITAVMEGGEKAFKLRKDKYGY